MSTSTPGPGITWLAHHCGKPEDELLADRSALLRALAAAGRDAGDLVSRLASDDPEVRAAAEVEARAVRSWFAAHDDPAAPTPGERFGSRVAEILRDAAQRVRDANGESSTSRPSD